MIHDWLYRDNDDEPMTAHSSLRAAYNTQQRRWRREFCAANTFCAATRWKWYLRAMLSGRMEEAFVVPYMGGNWAPDYVGLIHGPESTNMCFNLTDGCQMPDICPWESTVYCLPPEYLCTSLGHLLQNLARLMYIFLYVMLLQHLHYIFESLL